MPEIVSEEKGRRNMFLPLFGLAGGIGMPMQTSINAQLGRRVGSPFTAAMINFIVGTGVLIILVAIVERGFRIPFAQIAAAPPWILLGGVFAVIFVTGNILLMPRLGSVQTVILPALGQIIMGSLIDTFGWFDSAQRDMTALRILGVALVFGGVMTVIIAKAGGLHPGAADKKDGPRHIWLWRAFGLIVGMSMASQTAVNSHLGIVVESRFYAALINFCVGLMILIILHFALRSKRKPPQKEEKAPFWIWAGGLFGDLFVIGNIITAQTVGTGMAVVILLTGLMIGGLLVDQFGLFRSVRRKVGKIEILGVAIMVCGAILFHLM
jgi:transporter family-2 protein